MTMFPNENIGGFRHKLLKSISSTVHFNTKQSEQSTSWYISHHMAVFDLCKHLLHFVKNKVQLKLFGGGQSKIMGGTCPTCSPLATSLIWWGLWWVVSCAPSKLWACVRAHSFQRQRTHINLLHINILLNRHIVAQGCRQEIFQEGPNKNKSSINY